MSDICLIDIIYKQINKTYILRKHQFIVVFVILLTHTYQQTYTQKLQFKYLFDTFKDKSLHLSDVMQNYTYKSTSSPHWTNAQKHKHIHTLTHTYTHKHIRKHTMTQTQTKTYANTSKEWQKTILCKTFIVQIGFGHFFSFLSHSASSCLQIEEIFENGFTASSCHFSSFSPELCIWMFLHSGAFPGQSQTELVYTKLYWSITASSDTLHL